MQWIDPTISSENAFLHSLTPAVTLTSGQEPESGLFSKIGGLIDSHSSRDTDPDSDLTLIIRRNIMEVPLGNNCDTARCDRISHFPDDEDKDDSRNVYLLAITPRDVAATQRVFYWILILFK
jgi:hypothetical protein